MNSGTTTARSRYIHSRDINSNRFLCVRCLFFIGEMVRSCRVKGRENNSHGGEGRSVDSEANFFSFPHLERGNGPQVEEMTKRRRKAWVRSGDTRKHHVRQNTYRVCLLSVFS